ncbi:RNA polymerase I-specific transcription initiation factor RRN3-domain-containing protein [Coniochaeta sp. 2T2.1]|nr:RNA polymerase I-specific transcription initiation factor RRN3-domain-containing protein [Coniochaeta sp. 2T2.1]
MVSLPSIYGTPSFNSIGGPVQPVQRTKLCLGPCPTRASRCETFGTSFQCNVSNTATHNAADTVEESEEKHSVQRPVRITVPGMKDHHCPCQAAVFTQRPRAGLLLSNSLPTPVKPILRKSPQQVLGTRSRDDEDDDTEPPDAKRRKTVMFDESLNMVKDLNTRSLDQVKQEVSLALDRHGRRDEEDYDNLKEIFGSDQKPRSSTNSDDEDYEAKSQDLLSYVVALTSNVTSLGKNCGGLVKAILGCSWLTRDDVFAKAYVQFLAALSSAQGIYLAQVLSMIVDHFSETRLRSPPNYPPVSREIVRQRLHLGLRYLLALFPSARSMVVGLITANFPFSSQSKAIHLSYIDNLLRLIKHTPEVERDIMELITSRVVGLDVEMQLDLEDLDDKITAAVMLQLRANQEKADEEDDDADDSDAESVLSDDDDIDENSAKVIQIRDHIEKMDAILDTLFELYTPYFADPDSPEAISCYENMLSDFSNVVLPTYRSRHSQFLVFYFGQKSTRLTEMFVGTLFNIAFESNRPSVVKQSAVAYLASFVARGARVTGDQVQTIARTLLNYMDYHRHNYEPECRGPDLRRYTQYYMNFQALLYLFCFRWRDLINLENSSPRIDPEDPTSYLGQDLDWMMGLKSGLQNNIFSKLNPLKVCSPGIVAEFAKLSRVLNLMYIYPRLEANKRIQLSQFVGAYSTGGALRDTGYDPQDEKWTHLDPYFPFDPYQLPISRRRLEESETYLPWTSILDVAEEEEDDDDDDESDEEEVDEDEDSREDHPQGSDDDPERPSFESWWKRSKDVLKKRKITFVQAGSGSQAGDEQDASSSQTPQDKAKARRAQVRRAQIEHRQRKANYVKQLEIDVARIRDMIAATQMESRLLQTENNAMRSQLVEGCMPPTQRVTTFHPETAQPFGTESGHTLMASSLALRTAPGAVFDYMRAQPPFPEQPPSAHAALLAATAETGAPPPPPISWPASGLTLHSLYGLASSVNPSDLEVAPVQAWFELAARYPLDILLRRDVEDRLKREFVGVVKCPHYGAAIERGTFDSICARVLEPEVAALG